MVEPGRTIITAPGRGRTADLQVTESWQELLERGRDLLRAVDRQLTDALGNERAGRLAEITVQALNALTEGRAVEVGD